VKNRLVVDFNTQGFPMIPIIVAVSTRLRCEPIAEGGVADQENNSIASSTPATRGSISSTLL
jgi:hypothetical protein